MLSVSPPVAAALRAGKPVVALESTIVSHGRCMASAWQVLPACTAIRALSTLHPYNTCRAREHACSRFHHAGMPYPQNLQTALEVEAVVSQHGAVPATIAIIGGQVHIGRRRVEG